MCPINVITGESPARTENRGVTAGRSLAGCLRICSLIPIPVACVCPPLSRVTVPISGFHSWGVNLAVYLQTEYWDSENLFQWVSSAADLHTTFFVFFPIWFHLCRDVAVKLIWLAVVGDWLNLVLKWVLFGERSYWRVHETKFYGPIKCPELQQFSIT
ncbi:glucose-6-phosphatase catalytic subunit 1-like [Carassius gibelio]|uniref:glucose-6-phosphatase catalytic subunit 1-like n=1 Tax=Carassius gibelio TaxID=101364 RepID=UPI002278FD05|nr:glucose-6-phosphatase catalytic subunit 1-like [Carassius gibelio]